MRPVTKTRCSQSKPSRAAEGQLNIDASATYQMSLAGRRRRVSNGHRARTCNTYTFCPIQHFCRCQPSSAIDRHAQGQLASVARLQ